MPKTTRGSMALLITLGMFTLLGGTMWTAYDDQAEATQPLIIETNNSLALKQLPTEGLILQTTAKINSGGDDTTGGVSVSPTPLTANSQMVVGETRGADTKSELPEIVAYIAYKFEPEGKDVVVKAINCFYSESGLRSNAVGQNSDGPRSKDWNVAQLNDYWHNLSEEEKTDYKANIDRAYQIYKGRGGNFSAWYGKLCN